MSHSSWLCIVQDLDSATEHHGRRLPSIISLSDENVSLMKSWIQNCRSNHDTCKVNASSWVPSRLIDIDPAGGSGQVRLVTTKGGTFGPYTALSHVWGDPNIYPLPLSTKMNTLEVYSSESGIPFSKLSRNFQNAVDVTYRLGFRYLWIDSLCIVQDWTEDILRELQQMQKVYRCAALTIAAWVFNFVSVVEIWFLTNLLKMICFEAGVNEIIFAV